MRAALLVFLICLVGFSTETPTPNQIAMAEYFGSLLVSIEAPQVQGYYGTGWITGISDSGTEVYVTLPAHLLPQPRNAFSLEVRSWALGNHLPTLEVLAEDPGNDLALARFSIGNSSAQVKAQVTEIVTRVQKALKNPAPFSPNLSTALVGVPGYWVDPNSTLPRIVFVGGELYEDSSLHQENGKANPWDVQYDTGKVGVDKPKFSSLAPARELKLCPSAFQEDCYELTVTTQGFSGGMALANQLAPSDLQPTRADEVLILGMVTHFSPLAPISYVTPTAKVVEYSNRLLKHFEESHSYYVQKWDQDQNPTYEYIDESTVKILRGPLAGKNVQRVGKPFVGGGWDSSKGGWDHSKGGWDSSKGGGDQSGAFFQTDPFFNVVGSIKWEDLLSELVTPQNWNQPGKAVYELLGSIAWFKGIGATLNYRPGVLIDGALKMKMGTIPLQDFSQFLEIYHHNPSLGLLDSGTEVPVPLALNPVKGDLTSTEAFSTLRKLKSPLEIYKMDHDKPGSVFITDAEGAALLNVVKTVQSGKIPSDVVAARSDDQITRPIQITKFERKNGQCILGFALADDAGKIFSGTETNLVFPDNFEALGNGNYRYSGSMIEMGSNGYGVVLLQYLGYDHLWEMKAVIASSLDADQEIPDVFTHQGMNIDSFFVRLGTQP